MFDTHGKLEIFYGIRHMEAMSTDTPLIAEAVLQPPHSNVGLNADTHMRIAADSCRVCTTQGAFPGKFYSQSMPFPPAHAPPRALTLR
jgi:hypothetical protein